MQARILGVGAGARAHPWGWVSPLKMHYTIAFKRQSIFGRPPLGEILYPPLQCVVEWPLSRLPAPPLNPRLDPPVHWMYEWRWCSSFIHTNRFVYDLFNTSRSSCSSGFLKIKSAPESGWLAPTRAAKRLARWSVSLVQSRFVRLIGLFCWQWDSFVVLFISPQISFGSAFYYILLIGDQRPYLVEVGGRSEILHLCSCTGSSMFFIFNME